MNSDQTELTLLDLNWDCCRHILNYLPLRDVIRTERLCRKWQTIVLDYLQEIHALDVSCIHQTPPGHRIAHESLLRKPAVRVRRLRAYSADTAIEFAHVFAELVDLTLVWTSFLMNLIPVASCCKQLKSLTFEACFWLTDVELSEFFIIHKTLEKLTISDNRKTTGRFLIHAPPTLKTLAINHCREFRVKLLIRSARRFEDLKVFEFNRNGYLIENLADFFKYTPKLEELSFVVYKYARQENRGFLKGIFRLLRQLKRVTFFANRYVCDETLVKIGQWCPKLESLDVSYCGVSDSRKMGVTDTGVLAICRGCPNLSHLTLTGITEISDSSLRELSKCTNLTELIIRELSDITTYGLAPVLEKCHQLKVLDVTRCSSIDSTLVDSAEQAMTQMRHSQPLTIYGAITQIPHDAGKPKFLKVEGSGGVLLMFCWRHSYFMRSDAESDSDTHDSY